MPGHTVPCATSVALLVSVDAGPADVAASVCGEQSEFEKGTTAASVRAAGGEAPLLAAIATAVGRVALEQQVAG